MEQRIRLDDITRGLRPEVYTAENLGFLRSCENARVHPIGGLIPPVLPEQFTDDASLTDAAPNGLNYKTDWPLPKFLDHRTKLFLYGIDNTTSKVSMYEVDLSTGAASAIQTKSWADYMARASSYATADFEPGSTPCVLDFYSTVMVLNGNGMAFRTGVGNNEWFTTNGVTIKAGCNYKDSRAIFGGFNPADCYALADWPTYLSSLKSSALPSEILATSTGGFDKNWVWWSSIGGGDMHYFLDTDLLKYTTKLATPDTGFDDNYPYLHWLWLRREMGARPMPWHGWVRQVRPMGDLVVVYGDNGVSVMLPVSNPYPTFGLQDTPEDFPTGNGMVSEFTDNPACRDAVAGDDNKHVFVGRDYNLWRLDRSASGAKATKLGFAERVADLGSNVRIDYNPTEGEFYIHSAAGGGGFVLNKEMKLGAVGTYFTGLRNGDATSTLKKTVGSSTFIARFGARNTDTPIGIQNVHKVVFVGRTAEMSARLWWRMGPNSEWNHTYYQSLAGRGEATFNVPCWQFEVEVRAANYANIRINDAYAIISDGNPELGKVTEYYTTSATE